MNKEDRFEQIRVDLRPFGWGIRDVDVIWPEGHEGGDKPGPNSVGSEQIQDRGVHQEDLDPNIEAGEDDIDSIFDQPQNSGGSGGFPDEMQAEEGD